jgi:hypothetical protein
MCNKSTHVRISMCVVSIYFKWKIPLLGGGGGGGARHFEPLVPPHPPKHSCHKLVKKYQLVYVNNFKLQLLGGKFDFLDGDLCNYVPLFGLLMML